MLAPLTLSNRIPLLHYLYDQRADTNDQPVRSSLRLFEDGRELPSPHANHQSIAEQGHGRYSHWGDILVFSSSDGTDSRANGRRYTVAWFLNRYAVVAGLALLLGVLLTVGKPSRVPEVKAMLAASRPSFAVTMRRHGAVALGSLLHVPIRTTRWGVRVLGLFVLLVLVIDPGSRWRAQVSIPPAAMSVVSGHYVTVPISSIRPRAWLFYDDFLGFELVAIAIHPACYGERHAASAASFCPSTDHRARRRTLFPLG